MYCYVVVFLLRCNYFTWTLNLLALIHLASDNLLQLEIKKWKDLHEQDIVKIESMKQEYDSMAKQVFDDYSIIIIYWYIVSDIMT